MIMLLATSCNSSNIAEESSIGGVKIGTPEHEVLFIVKTSPIKGEDLIMGATGEAIQEWTFPESGLSLLMASAEIGDAKSVFSITIKAPSKLKTRQGIGIGDSKSDVIKAYAGFNVVQEDEEFFAGQDVYLVGSIYDGMVFMFNEGKVSSIFRGAFAEWAKGPF